MVQKVGTQAEKFHAASRNTRILCCDGHGHFPNTSGVCKEEASGQSAIAGKYHSTTHTTIPPARAHTYTHIHMQIAHAHRHAHQHARTSPGNCSGAFGPQGRPNPPSSEDPHVNTRPLSVRAALAIPPHTTVTTWGYEGRARLRIASDMFGCGRFECRVFCLCSRWEEFISRHGEGRGGRRKQVPMHTCSLVPLSLCPSLPLSLNVLMHRPSAISMLNREQRGRESRAGRHQR